MPNNRSTRTNIPQVSVLVSLNWHHDNLKNCLDSIFSDKDIELEIIIYACKPSDAHASLGYDTVTDSRITFLNAESPDLIPSISRPGLNKARGQYIIFADSSDTFAPGALTALYRSAVEYGLQIVSGNVVSETETEFLHTYIPKDDVNRMRTGADHLLSRLRSDTYLPILYGHLIDRQWLLDIQSAFVHPTAIPDGSWMLQVLCMAERVMQKDMDVYHYLKPKKVPIRNVNEDGPQHAAELLKTANTILTFTEIHLPANKLKSLKSWLYAYAFRTYASAFRIITAIRTHGAFELPAHRMHTIKTVLAELEPKAAERCQRDYNNATIWENEYLTWHDNSCDPVIAAMSEEELLGKRIILVYNSPAWQDYSNTLQCLPPGYVLTLDQRYMERAFAVVFHIPVLREHLYSDLEKPEGQFWISWNMEPESKVPLLENETFRSFFDLRMDYHPEADVVCPYYAGFKPDVATPVDPLGKKNRVCMLISSGVNQSRREEYLAELMKYTRIDSYGRLFHNTDMGGEDQGWDSKVALYSQYKFVIAFENSVLEDYVTEKLYDPLLAGTVPIYLGAPNVEEYLPGDDCVVRADRFDSPKELAQYLERCYTDDEEYLKHYRWRGLSWREDFVRKVEVQDDSPFVRLCRLLDEKHPRT